MPYCSSCGVQNNEEAKFCSGCGKNLTSDTPPPISQKKRSLFKTGCLGILAVFFILGLIGSCMGDTDNNKVNTNTTKNTKPRPVEQPKPPQYDYVCDVANVGKVRGVYVSNVGVAITSIQEVASINTPFSKKKAQGVFKILHIVATNDQKDAVTLDATSYKLIDDKGREYSHSTEGDTQLQMSDRPTLFLKNINPGITIGGYVSYDVPKNANIVKMQFSGGFTGKKAELPFRVMMNQ